MRKGTLSEVISKARYSDDIGLYTVVYRDGRRCPEVSLESFIEAKDADGEPVQIPLHRIAEVKRLGKTSWRKRR